MPNWTLLQIPEVWTVNSIFWSGYFLYSSCKAWSLEAYSTLGKRPLQNYFIFLTSIMVSIKKEHNKFESKKIMKQDFSLCSSLKQYCFGCCTSVWRLVAKYRWYRKISLPKYCTASHSIPCYQLATAIMLLASSDLLRIFCRNGNNSQ